MMKLWQTLPVVLALLSTNAEADERMLPYINWITENSNLEYNGEELPTVVQIDYSLLEIQVFGEQTVAQAEFAGRQLPQVEGAYDRTRREIVFAEGVDPWQHDPTMVHELVHYLQDINNTFDDCAGNNEPQAYELHWQWVKEHNFDADEPSWLYVALLSISCRERHHTPYTADSPP